MATIHVNGRAYTIAGDQSLLEACLSLGFDVPYFCWHPAMGSVGACRQCAVKQFKDENDTQGRIVMSCMTAAAEGSRISIVDPEAVDFRKGIIEGMMLNHPHDCPVCDEGGQCQLQDMTVMTGHNYRRYRFGKRTFRNQYLGPLVHHEMNRCIQCYRCVRFYTEYAGGTDFSVAGITDRVFFGRASDGVFESEFAGNLAEVCPTGVFTDATLKHHYVRKWDLRWAPSICPHCSLGCNTSPGERYGQVRAILNRYHGQVNQYFLCDRGRFGYEYLESPQRVNTAEAGGEKLSPAAALARLQPLLEQARSDPPGQWIGVGSPRASLESNLALRELVGPDRFFAGVEAGEFELTRFVLETLRGGRVHTPSLREVKSCDAVLILGEDVTQTAARLALSLRQATRQQPLREISDPLKIPRWLDHAAREAIQNEHGPLYIATPAATKLDAVSTATFRLAPDDIARLGFDTAAAIAGGSASGAIAELAQALVRAQRPLVVTGAGGGSQAILEAAVAVAEALSAARPAGAAPPAVSFVLPEVNSLGLALLDPHPLREGMDMIRFGTAHSALVLETDLARRAPAAEVDAFFARFGVSGDGRGHLVVLDQIRHSTADHAELLLPAAPMTEGDGSVVSSEGRVQRFFKVGAVQPDERPVAARLAESKGEAEAGVRESWRWLEQGQRRQTGLDDMIARLVARWPALGAVAAAAPAATFRVAGQKIARETHRFSGRTSILADVNVSEPKPPVDADSALSYTMEGYNVQPPAALTPYFWSPGWNSPQAQLRYQNEVNGPLRGGDGGVRLFEAAMAGSPSVRRPAPAAFGPRPGEWLLLRLYHLFGSEELSRLAPAVAELAPQAYLAMNADDAVAAGLRAGALAEVELDGRAYALPLRIAPELPHGVVGAPAGLAAFDGAGLPSWTRVRPAAPPEQEGR